MFATNLVELQEAGKKLLAYVKFSEFTFIRLQFSFISSLHSVPPKVLDNMAV